MIEDGQIGFGMSLLWCVMLGGLLACVTAAGARGVRSREAAPIRGMGRTPGRARWAPSRRRCPRALWMPDPVGVWGPVPSRGRA